ncbi:MAG: LPXTG cell wall anchor domain-containing protein [Eubacteriales bacterium]|nr:LPXTG cell wall anchor domain-containing protein [Eubacteriales bacterium]
MLFLESFFVYLNGISTLPRTGEKSFLNYVIALIAIAVILLLVSFFIRRKQKHDIEAPKPPSKPRGPNNGVNRTGPRAGGKAQTKPKSRPENKERK